MKRTLLASLLIHGLAAVAAAQTAVSWKTLQPGVEFAAIPIKDTLSAGPATLHVVRVDTTRARLAAALASDSGVSPRTAAEWCRSSQFAVAINLGMYATDHSTHIGYLRNRSHLNNPRWNNYKSVMAIGPGKKSLGSSLWLDLDQSKPPAELDQYNIVVQNLRLIAGNRRNVWSKSDKRWSEAALAIDSKGRLLFLFSRAPHSMRDFNALLLKLPLDITQAMHLEGGPEASLSIHAGGVDLDLSGSFETGFWPNDDNKQQWPVPNVLGVLREPESSR